MLFLRQTAVAFPHYFTLVADGFIRIRSLKRWLTALPSASTFTCAAVSAMQLVRRCAGPRSLSRWLALQLGPRLCTGWRTRDLPRSHLRDPAYLMGGKTMVGALVFGLVFVEVIKRYVSIKQSTGDLYAIPLAFGIAIGRIGCFLTGLADNTYGVATGLPWGVDFGDGIRRHRPAL